MIIDKMLLFGTLAMTSSGALADVIDTKKSGDAIGDELWFHVRSYGDGLTNVASLAFKLQTCAASNFSSNVVDMVTVSGLAPVNGVIDFACRVPPGALRYLRATLTPTAVSDTTAAGCVAAFLTHGPQHSFENFKA